MVSKKGLSKDGPFKLSGCQRLRLPKGMDIL